MDVHQALRQRRMTRAFDGTPLGEDLLAALCAEAMRAPTAGHARGVEAVVLAGASGVSAYLGAATDEPWRAVSTRVGGFAAAGGAVVVVCDPATYAARYAEADKATSGLDDPTAWPVPYWYTDAAFFTMCLLLLAESDGLASCFLGAFRREREILSLVAAPRGTRLFGAVLLGHAHDQQSPSGSTARDGPTRGDRVRRRAFPAE